MTGAGLRSQRLRLYRRVNQGSDGMVRPAFVFVVERWGRIEELRSNVGQQFDRLQMTLSGAAEFYEAVDIPPAGIIVEGSGQAWWIRGITHARTVRRKLVQVDRLSDEEFEMLSLYDSENQMNGTHVVNPAE